LTRTAASGTNYPSKTNLNRILAHFQTGEPSAVSISERKKEVKRRRHRRSKISQLKKRATKATVSEKQVIVRKASHRAQDPQSDAGSGAGDFSAEAGRAVTWVGL
jgi:hypothetical protein